MSITQVVIFVHADYISVTFDAPQKGDTLTYQADGVDIYLRRATGASLKGRMPAIDNQALNVIQGLKIPVIALRRVSGYPAPKKLSKTRKAAQNATKEMF